MSKFASDSRIHNAFTARIMCGFGGFAGSAATPRCRATELLAFARNRIVTLARQSAIAPPRIEACDGKIGSILRGLLKGVKSASFRRYAIWCKGLSILQELPCGCSIPRKSSPDTSKILKHNAKPLYDVSEPSWSRTSDSSVRWRPWLVGDCLCHAQDMASVQLAARDRPKANDSALRIGMKLLCLQFDAQRCSILSGKVLRALS